MMWPLRPAYQLHRGISRDEVMSSTLVETVSINYDDFTESFLTCGTCLYSYDGAEHNPKLLPCSHTVCLHCLSRIVTSNTRDDGHFRCPICRESIRIPSGGVAALPPSFLVNQLLDLMSRQRREVIPKCSLHPSQLTEASDSVKDEMHLLDHAVECTFEDVNRSFQTIVDIIDRRREELITAIEKQRSEKRKVLQDQLDIIKAEEEKVRQECDGLQYQVEVRNITKKIAHVNMKIDSIATLVEPRENSFIKFDCHYNEAFEDIKERIQDYGRIITSKTFPSLCYMKARKAVTHLRSEVIVCTVDYDGETQVVGGDPVEAHVVCEGDEERLETEVADNGDGTYSIFFTPIKVGNHNVAVKIFGRPIKESPLSIEVIDEHNPDIVYGSRGSGRDQFLQPVGICIDSMGIIYIADTGNSRIKVLSPHLKEIQHIVGDALEGRSVTGLTITPAGSLLFVNWRTKCISELTSSGQLLNQFTHELLVEPITLSTNSKGEIIVADNAALCTVFVFMPSGTLVSKWGTKGNKEGLLSSVSALCTSESDDVIIADSRIQVFSSEGKHIRTIFQTTGKTPRGTYGGLHLDPKGFLLATRQERTSSCIQVFDYSLGTLIFCIDSREAKLKRPSGLATTDDGHVIIVDLGNDCIKKFRYM